MKISKRLHHRIYLKNLVVTLTLLAFLGVLAWFSVRYSSQYDWTDNSSNTLSEASIKLLQTLPDKIRITAYVDATPLFRTKAEQLVNRYRQYKPDIELNFVNPDSQPEKTRELKIGKQGAIVISYQWRTEKLMVFNEATLTSALLRLSNAKERWITFLTGHGERSPFTDESHDLSQFRKELQQRNLKIELLNLANIAAIPENSSLLVIASPTNPLLPAETDIIIDYIRKGGNLLWLTDPSSAPVPDLARILGIRILPGIVVDASSQLYGLDDPSFVVISKYPAHPITTNFQTTTVYPVASALETEDETDFQATKLINSSQRSWTETGEITGTIRFDADSDEQEGPLTLAITFTRDLGQDNQQRIVVMGDGDFLSDTYIGNVGNLDMGVKLINWLNHNDRLIDIPAKPTLDNKLELNKLMVTIMAFGFMVVLPLIFFITGFLIWRRRKNF